MILCQAGAAIMPLTPPSFFAVIPGVIASLPEEKDAPSYTSVSAIICRTAEPECESPAAD
jgi:hypothetical protein